MAALRLARTARGRGLRATYRRESTLAVAASRPSTILSESDLHALPAPVAAYIRRSGAIGLPRVVDLSARIRGRIRAGVDKRWMPFTGEQVNTYGTSPSRFFHMDARMFGLPVDVLHVFRDDTATMRVRVCSLVTIVEASGPDLDRAETVTVFNDMCVLAPAALVDADVTWALVDANTVHADFRNGRHTIGADLLFDSDNRLVDFISDDRLRASSDGSTFITQRWSTPLATHRIMDAREVATDGEAHWHAPDPEGEFCYLEFHLDHITYNVAQQAREL